jgi:lysophospholipase L1-like esterase
MGRMEHPSRREILAARRVLHAAHASRMEHPSRREILATTLAAGGGLALGGCASAGHVASPAPIGRGDVILFQGDSITDAGRSREEAHRPNTQAALGNGYAVLAAGGLLAARPDDGLRVFNRGISGNKVHELAERWDEDALALEPDVLSLLIGVNDHWHTIGGGYDGTPEVYERDYDALLARTRAALPGVHLVVCEPFVLRCGAVDDSWFPVFDEYRAAARRTADVHGATWVGFQAMFDEAVRVAPPSYWAGDGVHPSGAGAALMAQAWLRAVGA